MVQWSYRLTWEEPLLSSYGTVPWEDWYNTEVRSDSGPWFADFFAMAAHCHTRIARIGRHVEYEYVCVWFGYDGYFLRRSPILG